MGNTLTVTNTVTGGNIATGGAVSAAGNVTGANLVTTGTVFGTDALFTGNLTVDGNVTYINITDLNVEDPIIGLGRGANNTPLTTNDGKDRGEQLWYFNTAGNVEQSAFVGYQNLTGKIIAASNVSVANDVVTVNSYGTFVVGNLEGATASLSGTVTGGNVATGGTLSVTGAATMGNTLSVTNTVTGGNIATGGTVSAAGNATVGNLSTAGVITATGTVTAGNVVTTGAGNIATLTVSTLANVTATTASTSTTTGALIVAGGVGVAGNIYAADMFKNGVTVLNANDTVDGGTY